MGRGGVKTFDALVDEVGDKSSVDGSANTPVVAPRSGMSRSVALRDLVGNPHNPRDSVGDLDELASIVEFQLQPVVAVTRGAFQALYPETTISARWVVIIGNRRLAAAHKFGRPELDIVIKDELAKDRATLLTAVISENVDRSGFDVIEEAKAVERLVGEYGSADAAAEHLRKSKTWVSHRRALLKLAPDLQEATRRGDLAIREARTLAQVPLAQQVARWNAARGRHGDGANAQDDAGERDSESAAKNGATTPPLRTVTRALRKFDTDPSALALALRDQLGDTGAKLLVTQLRKILK
ncbi:putative plasmid partitioning protein [Mycobacterium lentiflavum]|uniref:Peptide transporter n=2 Tax=Mycobacterium simiae complex TaxID=2249310 RepID=A0A0E4H287_MYCLN|nr:MULTISPECIES: peptide transporter [Mycobacterium simiae complex]ORJ54327.1 peptide transporter [Mycobacterium simiae]ULP45441.1 peptide transporter [Mycobacterium lentiflavum]CQD24567.1 putative plasmid partitioning protein [Mycobacterium lentiflavum]